MRSIFKSRYNPEIFDKNQMPKNRRNTIVTVTLAKQKKSEWIFLKQCKSMMCLCVFDDEACLI